MPAFPKVEFVGTYKNVSMFHQRGHGYTISNDYMKLGYYGSQKQLKEAINRELKDKGLKVGYSDERIMYDEFEEAMQKYLHPKSKKSHKHLGCSCSLSGAKSDRLMRKYEKARAKYDRLKSQKTRRKGHQAMVLRAKKAMYRANDAWEGSAGAFDGLGSLPGGNLPWAIGGLLAVGGIGYYGYTKGWWLKGLFASK